MLRGKQVLIAQRPPGKAHEGLWEFPGGKIEKGATSSASIIRELKEELDLSLSAMAIQFLLTSPFTYSEELTVDIDTYLCLEFLGSITPQENQLFEWVKIDDLVSKDLVAADVQIAQCLLEWFSKSPVKISS